MRILCHLWTQVGDDVDVWTSYQYVTELTERLDDMLQIAHKELQKAQQHQNRYYDLKLDIVNCRSVTKPLFSYLQTRTNY